MITSHPYAVFAIAYLMGLLSGLAGIAMRKVNSPIDRIEDILQRIEDEMDILHLNVEGNRKQTSSTGDQLLGELRDLKHLLQNQFFRGPRA